MDNRFENNKFIKSRLRGNKTRDKYSSNNRYRTRDAIKIYESKTKKKRNTDNGIFTLVVVIAAVIICIAIIFFSVSFVTSQLIKREESGFSNEQMKNDIYIDYSLIGMEQPLSIRGLTRQNVYDKVLGSYKWDLTITNSNPEIDRFVLPSIKSEFEKTENLDMYLSNDFVDSKGTSQEVEVVNPYKDVTINVTKDTYKVPDFLEAELKAQIDNIYDTYLYNNSNSFRKKITDVNDPNFKSDFKFNVDENDPYLDDVLSQLALLWNTKAAKGQIEGFDKSKNEFVFGDDHSGYEIDVEGLRSKILQFIRQGDLTANITTVLRIINPTGESIKNKYKYISTFETTTTDNEVRNKNVELACNAINGYILNPGQEFSFNKVVGERTEAKGYGLAQAYNQGEVVEELGGGVCQVSTTLYNAVYGAGLTSTYRRSHTFEPNYVTPGLDATVSYNGVDYRFINDSDYAVGIRANYKDRKVKVEIFSVPILEPGVIKYLDSKKIQDLDEPSISIIESGTAQKGTKGSEWRVDRVFKKGDVEIRRDLDHNAIYVGHTPTAFAENTYVDKEGILQTRAFRSKSSLNPDATTKASNRTNNTNNNSRNNNNQTRTATTQATTANNDAYVVPLPGSNTSDIIPAANNYTLPN